MRDGLHTYIPPTPPGRAERVAWAVAVFVAGVGLWGGLGWVVWRWIR